MPTWLIALLPVAASAAVGFFAGYRLKAYEFRTAEQTARVDEVINEIREIEKVASRYWSIASREEALFLKNELLGRLHRVNIWISFCAEKNWQFSNGSVGRAYLALKQAVTDGTFESSDYAPEPARLRRIYSSATVLMVALRGVRRSVL